MNEPDARGEVEIGRVAIITLGEFSIRLPGGELPPPAAQRRRMAVLLYLAAAGHAGVARERLLAMFWPERSEESARNLLNQALSAIRQLAPELVHSGHAGEVRLDSALVTLDASTFDQHCASKRWSEAIALYRGPFLDGFALPGAPDFDRWMERERARLERSYAAALEGMARGAMGCGDLLEAERWWRRLVELEPTSGRAVRALMQALADVGERAPAIEEARKYARVLREELGVGMDEETAEVVRRLQIQGRSSTAHLGDVDTEDDGRSITATDARRLPTPRSPTVRLDRIAPNATTRRRPTLYVGLAVLAVGAFAWGLRMKAGRSTEGDASSSVDAESVDTESVGRHAAGAATAEDFYQQARRYYQRVRVGPLPTIASHVDTAEYFLRRALMADPAHARSHAHLSVIGLSRFNLGQGDRWLDSASAHARLALAIDSGDAMSLVAHGLALYMAAKREEGRAIVARAVRLAPEDPLVLIAQLTTGTGRIEDDIALRERAIVANAADERMYWNLAFSSMIIDDTATMRIVDEKGFALFPTSREYAWGFHARRALVHVYRGDSVAARGEVQAFANGKTDGSSAALAGVIELALGNLDEARRLLEMSVGMYAREGKKRSDLVEQDHVIQGWFLSTSLAYLDLKRGRRTHVSRLLAARALEDSLAIARNGELSGELYDAAVIAALRGDASAAFHFLERAVDAGYLLHRWMRFDPRLESLRGDPRFEAVVGRAKSRADSIRALVHARRGKKGA